MQGARAIARAAPAVALALWSGVTPHALAADAARAAPLFPSRAPKDWVGPPVAWETLRGGGRQLQAQIEELLAEPAGGCEGSRPGVLDRGAGAISRKAMEEIRHLA